MARVKISQKQGTFSEKLSNLNLDNIEGVSRETPLEYLTDKEAVGAALLECLQNNDPEGVMEVLAIYFNALNIAQLRKGTVLSKSMGYHSLKSKNPTV